MHLLTCSLCPPPKNTLPPWCRYLISDQSILKGWGVFAVFGFCFVLFLISAASSHFLQEPSLLQTPLDTSGYREHFRFKFQGSTSPWLLWLQQKDCVMKIPGRGMFNFGVIPQISLHFRVIKSSSYKPGNANRAAAGTLQQCKLQALWLIQIYGGTHLPSNSQQWEYYCKRQPRAVVGAPHLETFKISTDRALATWSGGRCPCTLQRGGTTWLLKVLSNTNHSVVLWFFSPIPKVRGRVWCL